MSDNEADTTRERDRMNRLTDDFIETRNERATSKSNPVREQTSRPVSINPNEPKEVEQ